MKLSHLSLLACALALSVVMIVIPEPAYAATAGAALAVPGASLAMLAGAPLLGAMTAAERMKGRYMRGPDHADGDMGEVLREHFRSIEEKVGPLPDKVNEALSAITETKARLDELEQKNDRKGGGGGYQSEPSLGERYAESDEVKSFIGNVTSGRRLRMDSKAIITSATADADGSAGSLLTPFRDGIVGIPRRPLVMRDLLNVIMVGGNSIEYPKLTGSTNNSTTVAEGVTKPQSEMKFGLVSVAVRTIAHWVLASRQILDDAPQLAGFIDSELLLGLKLTEDNQILNGSGSGTDLEGIYPQATALSSNPMVVASPTKIDVIGVALLQNALANLPADGIVLHPADWMSMKLLKDTAGAYILGDPQSDAAPRLFGLPVVTTTAITADKFMVGAFQTCATLYDRWQASIEVSTEDSDNFRKNLVTVLAEERIALAVKNAAGFTKGDFSDAITDLTS